MPSRSNRSIPVAETQEGKILQNCIGVPAIDYQLAVDSKNGLRRRKSLKTARFKTDNIAFAKKVATLLP